MVSLPFTTSQFLAVFARYNLSVYPAQILLMLGAVITIILTIVPIKRGGSIIFGILGLLWLWMGGVYHCLYFSAINPLAYLFGALFILEAAILLYAGVAHGAGGFAWRRDGFSVAGLVCILYSLAVYPVIGTIAGHPYPELPTFGLPCPTTIFTFGILLLADRRVPWYLLVIPFVWACIGFFAALSLGITEDYGLLVAGVAGTLLIGLKNRGLSGDGS